MAEQLNSPFMYLVTGGIIFFVVIVCVVFLVRAYRAGKAIGMDVIAFDIFHIPRRFRTVKRNHFNEWTENLRRTIVAYGVVKFAQVFCVVNGLQVGKPAEVVKHDGDCLVFDPAILRQHVGDYFHETAVAWLILGTWHTDVVIDRSCGFLGD